MVDPARLAWGLREACLSLGVRIYEDTPVAAARPATTGAAPARPPHGRSTPAGSRSAPAPSRPCSARLRHYRRAGLRLRADDRAALARRSWPRSAGGNRQGIGDAANQFHYYRLTDDNRILWGGYDAIYYAGGRITAELRPAPGDLRLLAEHFFETFPQLAGLRFTHRGAASIDTCSRFCAFFGTAYGGRLAYAAGYTGLGVGATRFGAEVMLDLLAGERDRADPAATWCARKPRAVPAGAAARRRDRADPLVHRPRRPQRGRRNLWLRTLDRLGLGFDS